MKGGRWCSVVGFVALPPHLRESSRGKTFPSYTVLQVEFTPYWTHHSKNSQDCRQKCNVPCRTPARTRVLELFDDVFKSKDEYDIPGMPCYDHLLDPNHWAWFNEGELSFRDGNSRSSLQPSLPHQISEVLIGLDVDEEISVCSSSNNSGRERVICLFDPEWYHLDSYTTTLPIITLSVCESTPLPSTKTAVSFSQNRNLRSHRDLLHAPHPFAFMTSPRRSASSHTYKKNFSPSSFQLLDSEDQMRYGMEQRREFAKRKALRRMWCFFPQPEPLLSTMTRTHLTRYHRSVLKGKTALCARTSRPFIGDDGGVFKILPDSNSDVGPRELSSSLPGWPWLKRLTLIMPSIRGRIAMPM